MRTICRWRLFVIAKRWRKYRVLAAVNHGDSWEPIQPLWRCLNLLRIFSSPANRIALEQELVYLEAIDGIRGRLKELQRHGKHIFPFITTCAYLGFGTCNLTGDLRNNVNLGRLGDSLLRNTRGQNGSIIIDISNLDDVRYGLVMLDTWFQQKSFKDAGAYLDFMDDAFMPAFTNTPRCRFVVESLKEFRHVSARAISGSPEPPQYTARSLLESSMMRVLDSLSEPHGYIDYWMLNRLLDMQSVQTALSDYPQEVTRRLWEAPITATVVRILQIAFREQDYVDLSPFYLMTPVAVRSILRTLKHVRVLNLSGLDAASRREISRTLSAIDHPLDELYVLDPPDRISDDPMHLLRAVAALPFPVKRIVSSSMLSLALSHQPWMVPTRAAVPRATRASRRSQATTRSKTKTKTNALTASFPILQVIYSFRPEYDAVHSSVEVFYLGDALLSPRRLISGLLNILTVEIMHEAEGHRNGTFFAHAFATSGSDWKDRFPSEINALPAEAFMFGKCCDPGQCSDVRDLTPDTWTVVLEDMSGLPLNINQNWEPPVEISFSVAMLRPKMVIPAVQGREIHGTEVEVLSLEEFMGTFSSPEEAAELRDLFETQLVDGFFRDDNESARPFGPLDEYVAPMSDVDAVRLVNRVFSEID